MAYLDPKKRLLEISAAYHTQKWGKAQKSAMVDEVVKLKDGCTRKHALRWLSQRWHAQPAGGGRRRGPKPLLDAHARDVLFGLWSVSQCVSADRFAAEMRLLASSVERSGVKGLTPEMMELFLSVSVPTLDRALRQKRREETPRRRLTSRSRKVSERAKALRDEIPVSARRPMDAPPGYYDIDSVAHCDEVMRGNIVWTINATDIHTGWCVKFSVFGLSAADVVPPLMKALDASPIPCSHIHTDNGIEYINRMMLVETLARNTTRSRSRVGMANDNPRVEQKNFMNVRGVFGYTLREKEEVAQMNVINALHMQVINLYTPSKKLIAKTRDGAKVRRVYSAAMTPIDRAVAYYEGQGEPLPPGVAELLALREAQKHNVLEVYRRLEKEIKRLARMRARKARKKEAIYA